MIAKSGDKFGRLTLVTIETSAARKSWICQCECGKEAVIRWDSISSGKSQSCGCLRDEAASRTGLTMVRHGQAKQRTGETSAEYTAWLSMKARCQNNPKKKNWHRYAGRGISVCAEWENDFQAFFDHIGSRPSPDHSVDRYPNNDGNYEPGNVRWATSKEQQNNRSDNIRYLIRGEELTATEAAQKYGKRVDLVYLRLSRGWTIERAVGVADGI